MSWPLPSPHPQISCLSFSLESRQAPATQKPGKQPLRYRAELGKEKAWLWGQTGPDPVGSKLAGGVPHVPRDDSPSFFQWGSKNCPLCCCFSHKGSVQDALSLSHLGPERVSCPFVPRHRAWPGAPSSWATLRFCFPSGGGTLRYLLSARLKPTWVENGKVGCQEKGFLPTTAGKAAL